MNFETTIQEMIEFAQKEPVDPLELIKDGHSSTEKYTRKIEYQGHSLDAMFTIMQMHDKMFRKLSLFADGGPPPDVIAKKIALCFFDLKHGMTEVDDPSNTSKQYLQMELL